MVNTPTEFPLDNTNFPLASRRQWQMASWSGVGAHAQVPVHSATSLSQGWALLRLVQTLRRPPQPLPRSCCVWKTLSLDHPSLLALTLFPFSLQNRSLGLEGRALLKTSHFGLRDRYSVSHPVYCPVVGLCVNNHLH